MVEGVGNAGEDDERRHKGSRERLNAPDRNAGLALRYSTGSAMLRICHFRAFRRKQDAASVAEHWELEVGGYDDVSIRDRRQSMSEEPTVKLVVVMVGRPDIGRSTSVNHIPGCREAAV